MSEITATQAPLSGNKTRWLSRMGKLGFAFFLVKGIAWLMLPLALWLID
ncbi:MAG: hypothetical protein OEU49_12595 [Chromatiales bacterium]|jgi:hypothetical protein|nr:hypothetical protein [Chromatiales bacterium]